MRGYLVIFILVAICNSLVVSQDQNNLALDAIVRDMDGGKLTGVKIKIIQDGALVDQMTTGKNGRFDVLLDFDHQFLIEMSKSGYVPKSIQVNTKNVPEDEQAWGYEYGGLAIDLFKKIPTIDYSVLDGPVAKFYYDPNLQNFDYDKLYTKQIKAELDELTEEYERKQKLAAQLEKQAERDYLLAMKDADNAFNDGDYLLAKDNYLAAVALKPEAKEPQQKLKQIEQKIQETAGKDDKYNSLLSSADKLFGEKKFDQAVNAYEEALVLKPNEQYPKDKIAESKKESKALKAQLEAEALLAEKDRKYNEEIRKADEEFAKENYANAKTYYQNALGFKPDEAYPKGQIKASENKIQESKAKEQKAAELAALNEKYQAQIARADAAFNSENYNNAQEAYKVALEIKSDESYPKDQLNLIEDRLNEIAAKQAEKQKQEQNEKMYMQRISAADKAFTNKEYALAKTEYEEALKIKDDEYPKSRLLEIEKLLSAQQEEEARLAREKEIEDQYNALVRSADDSMEAEDYRLAKTSYEKAIELKPEERYPQNQIQKIDDLILQSEQDAEYSDIISQADKAFGSGNYDTAESLYNQAISSNPEDNYPVDKIKEITKLLDEKAKSEAEQARLAAMQKEYDEQIAAADLAFDQGNLAMAKSKYRSALSIKAQETYPSERIAEIEKIESQEAMDMQLAEEQRRIKQKYDAQISKADQYFAEQEWDKARTSYEEALKVDDSKTYPTEKIAEIERIVSEAKQAAQAEQARKAQEAAQKEIEENYANAIRMADAFYSDEDYKKARAAYAEAADIKPAVTYARDQVEAIDKILAEKEQIAKTEQENRLRYNELISSGDRAVVERNWNEARKAFTEALEIFPDETIPAARLEEIDQLEKKEEEEALAAEISRLTKVADKYFVTKDLAAALKNYKDILNLQPDNKHAQVRIEKINEIQAASENESIVVKAGPKREVAEDSYTEGNAKITVRTVTEGQKVDVYKRVIHSWGGKYFFLNEQPISELVWNRDSAE